MNISENGVNINGQAAALMTKSGENRK